MRLYRLSADGREVLHEVTKRLGDRRLHCQSRLEDLVFRDARARLAALLRRSLEHEPDAPGLAFTQEERARLIGATRQTVSTALREPIDAGLVKRLRGRLHVADTGGLRAVAGLDA